MNVQRIGKECNALSNGHCMHAGYTFSECWCIIIHNLAVRQHLL